MVSEHYTSDVDNIIAEEIARALQHATRKVHDSEDTSAQSVVPPHVLRKSAFQMLPAEVLLHIFQLTVPPIYAYDPAITAGPHSAWMISFRTRKALTLTCRAFAAPATEVLYRDIVLRRMGQIPALARTLDPARTPSADSLARLIHRLRIDSCVVWEPFAEVVREELDLIMQRCTALGAFSYRPHSDFALRPHSAERVPDPFHLSWLLGGASAGVPFYGALHSPVAHALYSLDLAFRIENSCEMEALDAFLVYASTASRLTTLKLKLSCICVSRDCRTRLLERPDPPDLRYVEDLTHSGPANADVHESWFVKYICQSVRNAPLRALTITNAYVDNIDTFLHQHGENLTYLHLHTRNSTRSEPSDIFEDLGEACPRLEHLVLDGSELQRFPICSPTLRFIDFWGPYTPHLVRTAQARRLDVKSDVPQLERMRVLAVSPGDRFEERLSASTLEWPRICHPAAVDGTEGLWRRFPATRVLQTAWGVLSEGALAATAVMINPGEEEMHLSGYDPVVCHPVPPEDPFEESEEYDEEEDEGSEGDAEDEDEDEDIDTTTPEGVSDPRYFECKTAGNLYSHWVDEDGGTLDREAFLEMYHRGQRALRTTES
ncbi:hypothetical protein C2E23DRAFT_809464 [Lenzites betulinus]|nr:hypothetical protein C2E23DRAFT_809464 [Lenzites betulinus]